LFLEVYSPPFVIFITVFVLIIIYGLAKKDVDDNDDNDDRRVRLSVRINMRSILLARNSVWMLLIKLCTEQFLSYIRP